MALERSITPRKGSNKQKQVFKTCHTRPFQKLPLKRSTNASKKRNHDYCHTHTYSPDMALESWNASWRLETSLTRKNIHVYKTCYTRTFQKWPWNRSRTSRNDCNKHKHVFKTCHTRTFQKSPLKRSTTSRNGSNKQKLLLRFFIHVFFRNGL